ncbi:hypothetical protein DM02DRAFT_655842 [Periconia macrospinosa]|uniref:Uncharacterized protein n=1 Tax=Periconia macrospinosa TaxID=97972 RepID=A0A2V1DPM2_9PLEO|nr:hypothetical protein DM02DRAFT_655842 [Periconia macrospinosa]
MNHNVDVTTVSLGGNNFGFGQILNNCIYHFYWLPIIYDYNCDASISKSEYAIHKPSLLKKSLRAALDVFMDPSRKRPKAVVLVTGYARFWWQPKDTKDHNA